MAMGQGSPPPFRRLTGQEIDQYRVAITNANSAGDLATIQRRLSDCYPEDFLSSELRQWVDFRLQTFQPEVVSETVASSWTPLTVYQEQEFLSEIEFQCQLGMAAFASLDASAAQGRGRPPDSTDNWLLAYALLGAAARLSQLLFTTPERAKCGKTVKARPTAREERALWLRRAIGLSESNALKDRRARNHLEHFDERLDIWLVPGRPMHFDKDVPAFDPVDPRVLPLVSRVFIDNLQVIIQGVVFDLREFGDAIKSVQARANWKQQILGEIVLRDIGR